MFDHPLARLGWRTKYIGRLADDRFGDLVRRTLTMEAVDITDTITVDKQTNRFAIIVVDRTHGTRTVLWRRDPSLSLRPDDINASALASAKVLLVGSDDAGAMVSAARRARAAGVRTVGDLEHVSDAT